MKVRTDMKNIFFIEENPYRILGLYGNASTKDIYRQLEKINAYSRVGKHLEYETDYIFLGQVNRNLELLNHAMKRLEQPYAKALLSSFWFSKFNQEDKLAFDHLIEGNTVEAEEIWRREADLVGDGITRKNFPSKINLSTLLIIQGFHAQNMEDLMQGISLKCDIFSSRYYNVYIKTLVGKNFTFTIKTVIRDIINELIQTLDLHKFNYKAIIKTLDSCSDQFAQEFKIQFSNKMIQVIESEIKICKSRRKRKPDLANNYANELLKKTSTNLKLLKKTLGKKHLTSKTITNSLIEELLESNISYWNKYLDNNNTAPVDESLKIMYQIKKIGPSGPILYRFNKNLEIMENSIPVEESSKEKTSTSSPGGGCYIATMAYEDYNHPQVMQLRKFRDNVLNQSWFGKSVIQLYYMISPTLVKILKNNHTSKQLIKKGLDHLINKLN